eukprot:g1087.t1
MDVMKCAYKLDSRVVSLDKRLEQHKIDQEALSHEYQLIPLVAQSVLAISRSAVQLETKIVSLEALLSKVSILAAKAKASKEMREESLNLEAYRKKRWLELQQLQQGRQRASSSKELNFSLFSRPPRFSEDNSLPVKGRRGSHTQKSVVSLESDDDDDGSELSASFDVGAADASDGEEAKVESESDDDGGRAVDEE